MVVSGGCGLVGRVSGGCRCGLMGRVSGGCGLMGRVSGGCGLMVGRVRASGG
jgi:hypothetical protein